MTNIKIVINALEYVYHLKKSLVLDGFQKLRQGEKFNIEIPRVQILTFLNKLMKKIYKIDIKGSKKQARVASLHGVFPYWSNFPNRTLWIF